MINIENISELSGIYKFTNKINNKVYIGQGKNLNVRIKEHLRKFINSKINSYFYKSVRKNGIENFELHILIEGTFSKQELNQMEIKFIELFKSNNELYGYNLTKGGDGVNGYIFTEEHREKLSKTSKGRKQSPESIEKTRQANLGRKMSSESIEKRKQTRLKNGGYKISEETVKKILESRKWYKPTEETKNKMKGRKVLQETRDKIGKAHKGKITSEETKEKLRQANLGHIVSQETRDKMSKALKGRKHSEETKQKMKGRKHSEETRKKLSDAKKGILVGRKQTPEHIKKCQQVKNFNKLIKVIQQNNFICYWLYFKCIEIYIGH